MFFHKQKSITAHKRSANDYPECLKNYSSPEGKDLFLVMGSTGAGSSTFVNYMAGCQMEKKLGKYCDECLVVTSDQKEICRASESTGSTTFYPQVVLTDIGTFLDCPAYNSTFSSTVKESGILASQFAISKAQSIRGAIILIPYQSFNYARFLSFIEYLEITFNNFYQYKDSFLFLVTNAPKRAEYMNILKTLELHAQHADYYRNGKSIINFYEFIKNKPDRLLIFDPTSPTQRATIADQLQTLTSIPKLNIKIQDFDKVFTEISEQLKSSTNYLAEVIKKRTDLELATLDISLSLDKQAMFKRQLMEINAVVEKTSHEVDTVLSFLSMINQMNSENIDRYVSSYLKNMNDTQPISSKENLDEKPTSSHP